MFTGLIESVGRVSKLRSRNDYRVITIDSEIPVSEIVIGESIAVNGACLTVTNIGSKSFDAEASPETIARTTFNSISPGHNVNLERAMKLGDRLGGHLVSGHIDTVGRVASFGPIGLSHQLSISFPDSFDRLIIEKGSIAIDGVSLTINNCSRGLCSVNIIPHTIKTTNLHKLKAGSGVNLEFDLIGKYILKSNSEDNSHKSTVDRLRENGW